jgi:hypothetical protein
MARLIELPTRRDARGALTVIERCLPFDVRRVFVIHGVAPGQSRGGHRHRKTRMALVCFAGACTVDCDDGRTRVSIRLDQAERCLVLEPADWHVMRDFTPGAVLTVLASEHYDAADYIHEPYPESKPAR